MDGETLSALISRQCATTRYVVPLCVGEWFKDEGVPEHQIIELDWWDERVFSSEDEDLTRGLGNIKITCVPAQHHSARAGIDKKATLWAGFVIEQFADKEKGAVCPTRTAVYFAG
jgi:N-acyl-phosphatidylethanolamine-hydrolysing phospholipase D